MDTHTEYKILEGNKVNLEKELNELSRIGWMVSGYFTMVQIENEISYTILLTRYIQ